jgi:formate hydrogenlyase subunit 3/multisubunit Na+/H+ antiporter MnhD subunit
VTGNLPPAALTNAAYATGPWLLVATLAAPLALLAACQSRHLRRHALAIQWLAPLPAIAAAFLAIWGAPVRLEAPALRLSLSLDLPGAMLLAVAALLWMVAGFKGFADVREEPQGRIVASWLLTMSGSLGVFIAADLLTFYLVYALVSIPAYALVAQDNSAESMRAGGVYMAVTILGEAALLLGFAVLAAGEPNGSLRISDVLAALPNSPWRDGALFLIVAGFGMKIGLAPLNGWMPLAYTAAPIPAAAVLSGAAVKAGVIGFIRFLPFQVALPGWANVLALLGFFSAFYGVAIGITQQNPRTVLAYSSISQMGVIAAVFGSGIAAGDASTALVAAFYAANHVLVKGGLFLAVGVVVATSGRLRGLVLSLAAALALSLAGLPLTGGALAKLAIKAPLGDGAAAALGAASAAATTLLMLHFLICLVRTASQGGQATVSTGAVRLWVTFAISAILIPWLWYPAIGGFYADAFVVAKLWGGLWPLLIGAALALARWRWGDRLPRVPEGDTIVVAEAAFNASLSLGTPFERVDACLRQWPAGSLSLMAAALILTAAAAFGR